MYKEEASTYIRPNGEIGYKRNKIVEIGTIKEYDSDKERYYSLFSFDESILEYVKLHETVTGFKGKAWCNYLWIDMDNKDLDKATKDTITFVKRLNQQYNLSVSDIVIYFSGNKGFHIGVSSKIFGEFEPSHDLPDRIKLLAQELTNGIESADCKIYETVRVFRFPNCKSIVSGLYKIEVTLEELYLGINMIKVLAEKPRKLQRVKDINSVFANELLRKEWNNIQNIILTEGKEEKKEDSRFWEQTGDGGRHTQLYRQAAMIFDKSELSKEAVYKIMYAMNQLCDPPINDLNDLVNSAYKKTSLNKKTKNERVIAKPFSGWVDEYIDYTFHQSSQLTTGFESYDKILRGKLKGKLGCIIGYGGSKKSLFALNSALKNIHSNNSVVLYSTMEMSTNQLMNRILDVVVESENNFSYEIEKMKMEDAKNFLKENVAPLLGNKLHITQNSSLTCDDFDKLISQTISQTGRLDQLIVDGLSMMGGDGKETERYSDNTKELKELANKWNILIYLICHASKGAEKHSRDLIEKVRGSEKIFDNCDFIITLSQIIDITQATQDVMEYRNDKGYARMYDKRGSGKTLNKIFDFKSTRLLIEESIESPYSYEYKTSDLKKETASPETDFKF